MFREQVMCYDGARSKHEVGSSKTNVILLNVEIEKLLVAKGFWLVRAMLGRAEGLADASHA